MKKRVALIIFLVMILVSCTGCFYDKQLFDTTHDYDRAIVYLPNGEIVEGRVSSWTSWTSFGDSGTVQIKIDGKTYLTHICDVCLIDD